MEYQYSDCENNQEYIGSSIHESNSLTQCPINTCEDRSTEVFRHNNVHMSNVAEVQLTTNSNIYGSPEGRANVGSKISFSNQRILEDLSHSKPLYLTRANEINVQKSIENSHAQTPQTLRTEHQVQPVVSSADELHQTMQTHSGGTYPAENNGTSIHISFSENYLHEEREQDRCPPGQLGQNEVSHCSYGNGTPKIGSR